MQFEKLHCAVKVEEVDILVWEMNRYSQTSNLRIQNVKLVGMIWQNMQENTDTMNKGYTS